MKTKKFIPGWYTKESFNGIMTYWLAFKKAGSNKKEIIRRINTCDLVLYYFDEMPKKLYGCVFENH